MVKFKNLIFLCLFSGILISSFLEFTSSVSFQIKIKGEDFNLKTNGFNDSWSIDLESFGLDMTIDLNDCIYVMSSESYHCGFGCVYYGDVIIMKYNQSGTQIWRIDLEGLRVEHSGIAVDSMSNLYLVSMYDNQTIEDSMILFKFNSSGELQWEKTWNGGENGDIVDIAIDAEDNVYIYGTSDLDKEFKNDLFIIKYNSTGDQQWFYIYEEINGEYEGRDMEIDSDNNLIVSGYYFFFENETVNKYHWLRCYNQSGDLKWEILSDVGDFYTLAIDSLNNVFSFSYSGIMKYDTLGNLLWKWNNNREIWGQFSLTIDSFDNLYAGTSISIPEDHHTNDLYVIKLNNSGNFEWYLTWGGSDNENLRDICIDSNNSIYLLADQLLIKNPENNGKSLTNEKLWNFYMILFGICFVISITSLFFTIKRKVR